MANFEEEAFPSPFEDQASASHVDFPEDDFTDDAESERTDTFLKQLKTQTLTTIRRKYLLIIKILCGVVFLLSVGWFSTIIYFKNQKHAQEHEIMKSPISADMHAEVHSFDGMKCPKRCPLDQCKIASLTYTQLKYYTCCKCFGPEKYLIRRIEYYPVTSMYFLVLQDLTLDPRNYTIYDLRAIQQLQNLMGDWTLVSDSDTTFWLRYGPIGIPQSQPPDERSPEF